MKRNTTTVLLALILLAASLSFKLSREEQWPDSNDPRLAALKLPAGFHAEVLYGPSEKGEGSWVSMCFDPKGRLLASDQYGGLYRLTLPALGDSVTKTIAEKIVLADPSLPKDSTKGKTTIGHAHGLLYAFNSLYLIINNNPDGDFKKESGLYRMQDTNGDDQFDKITLLKKMDGEGEHGPHSVVLGPDKKSIYVIAGNFTRMPKMDSYHLTPDGKTDNLFPLLLDPNGHDNTVQYHGGWIARVDSAGRNWELMASGFRNPFDLAFNEAGEMFTYDSDMEWDMGTPWYRPTRICHVTSGGEFGWRPGTAKWSPNYPDNLPALINIGQGSPTNLVFGGNSHFPGKYKKALFAFDWSFGMIYAIHLQPNGASYTATGEEFISGSPLPLTDGVFGPDGALYFMTGGRGLESALYRIHYGNQQTNIEPLAAAEPTAPLQTRRMLEAFHGHQDPKAVEQAWPYLSNNDRYIRYAARMVLESQPTEQWKEKTLKETNPVILTQAALALARKGDSSLKMPLLEKLTKIKFQQLNENQQLDLLRAIELLFTRMGQSKQAENLLVNNYLQAYFPSKNSLLNKELSKLLVYTQSPSAVDKTMALMQEAKENRAMEQSLTSSADLIFRNPDYGLNIASVLAKTPPIDQTWYAVILSNSFNGWNSETRKQYFEWYYKAYNYKGGYSFNGFINQSRDKAFARLPKDSLAYYKSISSDSVGKISRWESDLGSIRPKGPGRNWKLEEAVKYIDSGLVNRDFERGKGLFASCYCKSCHQMNNEGGVSGPDLTMLGNRFSNKDILEAIISPSKTISDQFGATLFYLRKGGTVMGRLIREDNKNYYVSQNPFAPEVLKEVAKKDVARKMASATSIMLPGMINGMNPEELKDFIAFLKSGGDKNKDFFKK